MSGQRAPAGVPGPYPARDVPGHPQARPHPGPDDGLSCSSSRTPQNGEVLMHRSDLDFASESGSSSMGVVGETTTSARALVPVVASDQRKAHVPTDPTALEVVEGLQDFQSVRPRLFGIAYGMLGRVADAEDVVQDVWVRWHGADRAQVRDRIAFLVTMTTRVALNVVVSARARREVPVDRGLPERLPSSDDPTDAVEQSVDLEDAVRLLLERLSPTERAVFLLREAFNYPFREIAEALEISEANARQVKRRARTPRSATARAGSGGGR